METVINIVKSWLATNRPELQNAPIHVDTQNGSHDLHFAKSPLLPGVNDEHVNEDDYHIATVTDNVAVEGGFVIPKVIKLTVKDGDVQKITESK